MIDDGDGQGSLHAVLTDDVFVEVVDELAGRRHFLREAGLWLVAPEDVLTGLDAIHADVRVLKPTAPLHQRAPGRPT